MTAGRRSRVAFAAGNAAGSVVRVGDVLDGHVSLDLECLDRIYLNGYVPTLQVGGQVVNFLTRHRGNPIPSPALLAKIGDRFRERVDRFALSNDIPVVRFGKGERKAAVMKPYLDAAQKTGRSQVVAIGTAQEFQLVFSPTTHQSSSGAMPQFSFGQGAAAGVGLLLLPVGRRLRTGVHQGVPVD